MEATANAVEKQAKDHTEVVSDKFSFVKKEERYESILKGTPIRSFSFTEQITFPEVSFKNSYDNKGKICMFTFIHDPNVKEYTLQKLAIFKKEAQDILYKSASGAYENGDKTIGDLQMKVVRFVEDMQYAEGVDDPYEPRLMTVSGVCSNEEFATENIRDAMVVALQFVGNGMKKVFEPKLPESRK